MNAVMNQASHCMGIGAVKLHGWFVYTTVLNNLAATDRLAFLPSGLIGIWIEGLDVLKFSVINLKVCFQRLKIIIFMITLLMI